VLLFQVFRLVAKNGDLLVMAKGDTRRVRVWIVDYDLPEGNVRRRFYRAVRVYLKTEGWPEGTDWSTQSVVFTQDQKLAEFIYHAASEIGEAHMYKGVKVK